MNERPSYSVSPDPAFAERLEARFLAELLTDTVEVDRSRPLRSFRTRRTFRTPRIGAVAALMLSVIGTLVLAVVLTPNQPRPVMTPLTSTTTTTSTSTTTRVPDGTLAPGDYSLGTFVVPLSFTIVDDGWSRLRGQRRVLLLERDQVRVALSAVESLAADTPQAVVDNVCPGAIQLGDSIDAELFGGQALRAVGRVITDCTIVLSTFGDLEGSRWALRAGSDITIITTMVDGELITAIADSPVSGTDSAELDRLLASFRPS